MRWTRELVGGMRAQPWLALAGAMLVLAVALSATAAFVSITTARQLDDARDRAVAQACVDDWQDVEARRDDAEAAARAAVAGAVEARARVFPDATEAEVEQFAVAAREAAASAAEQARGDIPDPSCSRERAEDLLDDR